MRRWLDAQPLTSLYTTAICEAEILHAVALLPAGRRRSALEELVADVFREEFSGRILPFDSSAARAFGEIAAARRRRGRPIGEFDAQVAAIASAHGAAVATRNTEDFAG